MNTFLKDNRRSLKKNIEFYFGRLIGFPLTTPEHVYFSLTNRCNLQCRMCDIYKNPDSKENEQSTSEVKAIIAQIKNMSINHIIFSGGEPLLRHDVLDLVEFAVAKGIGMVDIITNGTLLKDKSIKKIIKSKLNHITISLDGLGKINDEIRGKGVFEKAQLNMDKLNYYKAKYAAEFPTVGINFTIMNNNLEHILPIIEFARAKKCNILVLQPLLFDNTNMQEKRTNFLWPAEDKIDRLREIMKEVMKKKN
ncbi:MAG: radical SAM protein, partial [Candidatus Omnitrophota bacterium]